MGMSPYWKASRLINKTGYCVMTIINEMNTADLISIGALLTALISLLFSVKSFSLSKKAFQQSEIDHKDKYRDVLSYLIDGFRWDSESSQLASFAISYTNNAALSNSFKEIFLQIDYHDQNGRFNKAKLMPELKRLPIDLKNGYEEISLPINLGAKETKSGWITFKLPTLDKKNINIETYRVIAVTIEDKHVIVESHILKRIVRYEQTNAIHTNN